MTTADVLSTLVAGRYEDIEGLPADLPLATVAAQFPPGSDVRGSAFLGRRRAEFVSVSVPGFVQPVSVWLDGDTVVLIDAAFPPQRRSVPELTMALGRPDARLDARLSGLVLPHGQLVWLKRGLTLHVNPENERLLRVGVFVPTTLDGYEARLLLDLRLTPLPRARHD